MKYQVTPQQITNELYNIFSDDSRAAQYLTGSHPQYLGVLGWCGPLSPMNRAAFLSAFGAEQVAKAEQEARARVAEYHAAVDRSTYHRNEMAADAFELSGEVPAVGSFVWGRWSCLKGEGGPMGELEDLERMDQEGRENPRRLCEVVAVVDASPADFLDREACNRIARRFKIYGGSRYDEQDPQSLKGFPLTWELVFCVRCAGRWFLIDGQGYDYTRYLLMPDSYGRMFAPELDAIRADREAKEAAERAAEQAAKEERRRQYLERCAPWWGRLVDVEPLQDSEKSAPRGSDAMKAARRALQAAQRKNILTMCRAAFPGVKFACRRSNGWGASFVISWTDGPTEERFKEVAAVDLLFSTGEYYSNMDDSYSCDAKEFQDFAAKYMGYTYGSYECRREESAEFKAEICAKIRAAVPGIPEDGKIRENAQQSAVCALFADVPGVRLSVIVEHLDYNGITAAAWYIAKHTDRPATDGSPTTPTGTDGQGVKGQGVEGETSEGTPSEGSTGAAYGTCEKSPISEKPAAGLQLVDIAGGGVAVTGDSRATYKARKEIKSHGATWNKAAKQWEAHDPAAVASLREWFGVTVQDATPEASAPVDELPAPPSLVSYDPAEPVERADFHTSDEVAPTDPTDGSHPTTEETPTDDPAPSDGATGAAYGTCEKSPISEVRPEVEALRQRARNAGRWTSFDPEGLGDAFISDLENALQLFESKLPEEIRAEKVAAYISKWGEWLAARSRCISAAVTGPARFPVARAEKLWNYERNAWKRLEDWAAKVVRRCNAEQRLTGWDEVERLTAKAEKLERLQELMKEANKIVRQKISDVEKVDSLVALGFSEQEANEIMTPNYMGGIGFASFQLTNNLAKIKDTRAKIARHEALASKEDHSEEYEWGTLEYCYSDERYRLYFPGKPSAEILAFLKSHGWKWSRANCAWQRQITPAAASNLRRFVELFGGKVKPSPEVHASEPMDANNAPTDGATGAAYGLAEKSPISEEVAVSVPEVQEYKLKYLWGAWITKETIYAETDEEAIFDADEIFKNNKMLHNWNGVALVQGDRFVKSYRPIRCNEDGKDVLYNIETVNGKNRKVYVP